MTLKKTTDSPSGTSKTPKKAPVAITSTKTSDLKIATPAKPAKPASPKSAARTVQVAPALSVSESSPPLSPPMSIFQSSPKPSDPQRRLEMIREAAYYRAEKRGFVPGFEEEDWQISEEEIDHHFQMNR